jgi:hypothetical protein
LDSGVSITYFKAHGLGDEVFLESLSQKCKGYRWVANKNITSLQSPLNTLRQLVCEWKKVNDTLDLGSCGSINDLFMDRMAILTKLPDSRVH